MTNNNENPAHRAFQVGDRVTLIGHNPAHVGVVEDVRPGPDGVWVVDPATRHGGWYDAADLVALAPAGAAVLPSLAPAPLPSPTGRLGLGASGAWDSWVAAAQATPAQVSGGGGVRGANASTAGAGGGVAWVSAVGGLAVGPGPAGAAVAFGATTPSGVAVAPVPTDAQVDAMAEAAQAYVSGLGEPVWSTKSVALVGAWLVALRTLLDAGWFPGGYLRAAVGAAAIPSPAMIEAARAAASESWRTAARQGAVTDFEGAVRAAWRGGVARLLADGWRP